MEQRIKSEQVVIAAPLSFAGSSARIWKITFTENNALKWLALVPIALLLISIAWLAVLVWYLVFGLWLVPYRLFRRGQRKEKKRQLQHREIIELVNNQKTTNLN